MSKPYIEVEDTTTRTWLASISHEEVEIILTDWFRERARVPEEVDIDVDVRGHYGDWTFTAKQVVDNKHIPEYLPHEEQGLDERV